MTRQSGFKRAARERARLTGQRYTQARADLELINRQPFRQIRPVDPVTLTRHLERHYGVGIASVLPIDDDPATRPVGSWPGHYPSTLVVRLRDGRRWIARVFSSSADRVGRVHGDAEILRFLAAHDFPAERLAHEDAVTEVDGMAVIVTRFVDGGRPAAAQPSVWAELADLLGRLHALPVADGAVSRGGGAEEHDGGFHVGRPKGDLAAAMSFLVGVETEVETRAGEQVGEQVENRGSDAAETFAWLRDQVEEADDAEGLPEALTHSNYHPWAVVGEPGALTVVGWAGSGRGPRLPALAWLLRTAAETDEEANITAVMRGYSRHILLTDDEWDRLPAVLLLRPLWLACLDFAMTIDAGRTPSLDEGWVRPGSREQAARLASQAAAALRT